MPHPPPKNALLLALNDVDLNALHLQQVELPHGRQLARGGAVIEGVYFLDSGVASILTAPHPRDRPVEVAMVGREGAIGLWAIMGSTRAPHDASMLVAGTGWRAPADAVASAFHSSQAVRTCLLDAVRTLLTQIAANAAVNARAKSEERLARWLLMAHDRADTDNLAVTHDAIAQKLGVRRAGVSVALKHLENENLVAGHRGAIQILDREGLAAQANGSYAPHR